MILYKEANESKVFGVDFSANLATGETISSSTITSDTVGLTIGSPSMSAGIVTFRISGGVVGTSYGLTVSAVTSESNTYEQCVTLSINECDDLLSLVTSLRVMINDLETDPTYSDNRLKQVLCVAAQQVKVHLSFTDYTINLPALTITPNPTAAATLDEAYAALVVLKAACFIDTNALRTKAALAGIRATLGALSLDTSNNIQGYINTIKLGPCAMFDDLAADYAIGNPNIWKAILSPFINNQFDPRNLQSTEVRNRTGNFNSGEF